MLEENKRAASLDFASRASKDAPMSQLIEDAKIAYAWLFPEEKPSTLVSIRNIK